MRVRCLLAVSGSLGDSGLSLPLDPEHLLLSPCSGHRFYVTVVENYLLWASVPAE